MTIEIDRCLTHRGKGGKIAWYATSSEALLFRGDKIHFTLKSLKEFYGIKKLKRGISHPVDIVGSNGKNVYWRCYIAEISNKFIMRNLTPPTAEEIAAAADVVRQCAVQEKFIGVIRAACPPYPQIMLHLTTADEKYKNSDYSQKHIVQFLHCLKNYRFLR
jgi:hypothetical protein